MLRCNKSFITFFIFLSFLRILNILKILDIFNKFDNDIWNARIKFWRLDTKRSCVKSIVQTLETRTGGILERRWRAMRVIERVWRGDGFAIDSFSVTTLDEVVAGNLPTHLEARYVNSRVRHWYRVTTPRSALPWLRYRVHEIGRPKFSSFELIEKSCRPSVRGIYCKTWPLFTWPAVFARRGFFI